MAVLVFTVVGGLVAGALSLGPGGAVLGALLGLVAFEQWRMRARLERLESELKPDRGSRTVPAASREDSSVLSLDVAAAEGLAHESHRPKVEGQPTTPQTEEARVEQIRGPSAGQDLPRSPARSMPSPAPTEALDGIWPLLRRYLSGVGWMVNLGAFVLIFGMAFLVKYAADHGFVTVTMRLGMSSAVGFILVVVGLKQPATRRRFSLILQGTGVGVLYLTLYAGFRLYSLFGPVYALALMAVVAGVSIFLSVRQDARQLMTLGTLGGFLAPLLASTGSGSHVSLFTYYLVLSLGVFAVAWFKSWREVNLVGFSMTFCASFLWGRQYYSPAHFSSIEPFLAAFFLMYVGVSVLYGLRSNPDLRAPVDATLVFGVPFIAFVYQSHLVGDYPNGMAWTSAGLAGFYFLVSGLLARRFRRAPTLAKAFLSNGVVFTTLVPPFLFDSAPVISSLWALQGGAMVWLGCVKRNSLTTLFGAALQLVAAMTLIAGGSLLDDAPTSYPVWNGVFLSVLILVFAAWSTALFLSRTARTASDSLVGRAGSWAYLLVALVYWLGGFVREILLHAENGSDVYAWWLMLIVGTAVSSWGLGRCFRFQGSILASVALFPALGLTLGGVAVAGLHPFAGGAWVGWVLACGVALSLLYVFEHVESRLIDLGHGYLLLVMVIVSVWELERFRARVDWLQGGGWQTVSLLSLPALTLLAMCLIWRRADSPKPRRGTPASLMWPFRSREHGFLLVAGVPLAVWISTVSLVVGLCGKAQAYGLAFLPVLNPMAIAILGSQALAFAWWNRIRGLVAPREQRGAFATAVLIAVTLAWAHGELFRSFHHLGGISFDPGAMFSSSALQASVAALWVFAGLAAIVWGSRSDRRGIWLVGSGLMIAVVTKLFVIDLANSGTLSRIVAFVVVGVCLLSVGYFSPAPPLRRVAAQPGA